MSNHFPDATKMVSDTPRTDDDLWSFPGPMKVAGGFKVYVRAQTSRELERELNAANDRIKQLEQLGDVLAKIADENPYHINDVTRWLKIRNI